jgi:hypothetical protein
MATPLGRRLILLATLLAMGAALALLGGFTWVFAPRVDILRLGLCLLTLLAIVAFVWGVIAQRIRGLHAPRFSGKRAFILKPAAPFIAIIFAAGMIGWMGYANLQDKSDPSYRVHWIVLLLLLILAATLIYWRYTEVRNGVSKEDEFIVEENTRRREKIFEEIKSLATSPWFAAFPVGSTGARLKASMNWWVEEFQLAVPENGFVMAEGFINHFLEDAKRQVTFIDDLRVRDEKREDMLQEAERRTLEFINRTGRLQHRT